MAVTNRVQLIHLGDVPNTRTNSMQQTGTNARVAAPRAGAVVPGAACVGGSYSQPYFSWQKGNGDMGRVSPPVPFKEIDATAMTSAVQNRTTLPQAIGSGIDVAQGAVTRYYAIGWVAARQDLGTDPNITFTGEPMEGFWGTSRETVVIASNANLREVVLTVPPAEPPDIPGVERWYQAVYVFQDFPPDAFTRDTAVGYYIGQCDMLGGTVTDSFSVSNLNTRVYSPTTVQNAPCAKAIGTWGSAFAFGVGAQDYSSAGFAALLYSSGLQPWVKSYGTDKKRLWVRNNIAFNGNDPFATYAVNPFSSTADYPFQWPTSVIGLRILLGSQTSNVIPFIKAIEKSTDSTDDGYWTVLVLNQELPALITTPVPFIIAGHNTVYFGHPDPRLKAKCPAARAVDLSANSANNAGNMLGAITAIISDANVTFCLVMSDTDMFKITVPIECFAEGVIGFDENNLPDPAQFPVVTKVASSVGAVSPGCVFRGFNARIMGYDRKNGPWILDGEAPTLLDPNLNLGDFYKEVAGNQAQCDNCVGFYHDQRYAIWAFPGDEGQSTGGNEVMLCWDSKTGVLGFWQIDGQKVFAGATVKQYQNIDSIDVMGDRAVVSIGAYSGQGNPGQILEFNDNVFVDLAVEPENDPPGQGTVAAVSANYIDVTGTTFPTAPLTGYVTVKSAASLAGSQRMITGVSQPGGGLTRYSFDAGTSWGGGAPVVGSVVATPDAMPIRMMFLTGDIRVKGVRQKNITAITDLGLALPSGSNISWLRARVYGSQMTVTTEDTTPSTSIFYQADMLLGKRMTLVRSPGGRAVSLRLEFYSSPDGALQLDDLTLGVV